MKVRLKAWVENMGNGTYRVHCNDGSVTYPTYDYQSVVRKVNYINNEDSDGHYFDDGRLTEDAEKMLAKIRENKIAKANHREEVKEKREKKEEENRKSKRSNEKYVYVISLIQRGKKYTEYFKGETNLLKMDSFTTYKETDAKVYQTKASAQKVVDTLAKNYLVRKLYRNLKVVQKKRELFK